MNFWIVVKQRHNFYEHFYIIFEYIIPSLIQNLETFKKNYFLLAININL